MPDHFAIAEDTDGFAVFTDIGDHGDFRWQLEHLIGGALGQVALVQRR